MGEHRTKLFWKIKSEPHTENAALGEHRDLKTHHVPQLATPLEIEFRAMLARNVCCPLIITDPDLATKMVPDLVPKMVPVLVKKWYNFGTKNGSRFETSL